MFQFLKSNKIKSLTSSLEKLSNPLAELESINELKSKVSDHNEDRHQEAEVLFQEAISHLKVFDLNNKQEEILQAANKLSESLKFHRNNGKAYFWLAYIFYIFGKDKTSFQYLRTAESLSPDYQPIKEFKNIISF